MPEDAEAASAPAPKSGGGLLSGLKGWIIVIGALVLEAAFFIIYISLGRQPDAGGISEGDTAVAVESLPDDPTRVVSVKPLVYTLQSGAPPMQVSMAVTLVFGYTDDEKRNPKAKNVPSPAVLDAYKAYAEASTDYLRDHLNTYMATLAPSMIQGPAGLQRVRDEVKTYMNQLMQQYLPKDAPADLDRRRVTAVMLPEWNAAPME